MKRFIYFASWAVLTATDAILGYRTATTDFGIKDTVLATIWALGFSLLSVPAKVIYDRLIEETYQKNPIIGKIIFTLFSCVWLFVAYNAYTGVSELRKKDMRREQLAGLKIDLPQEVAKETAAVQVESQYDYRLAKAKLKIQAKQDSVKFAVQMAEQVKFRAEQMKLVGETDSKGFLYFNLLLILSASICLSLAFQKDPENQPTDVFIECETCNHTQEEEKSEQVANVGINQPNKTEPIIEEYTEDVKIPSNKIPYKCNDCGVVFNNYFGYNAHMRYNKIGCKKGNYSKLTPNLDLL